MIAISTNPTAPLANGPFPRPQGQPVGTPPVALTPDFGGGPANIAFLQGLAAPPTNGQGPNALGTQMDALFWIETVEYEVDVPELDSGLPTVTIELPPTNPPTLQPTFSATLPFADGKKFAGGKVKVHVTQIQHSQKVILQFAGLNWPHVSVATLLPSDPVPIPPELLPLT